MNEHYFRLCCSCLFACAFAVLLNGVEGGHKIHPMYMSMEAVTVEQTYRTGYHFQPQKHWINDPNGPMYYNGVYHLFYQYNPKGSVWGNIVWAHSVSKDLVNWEALEPAIYPSKQFDVNGCWSGSATILPGNKPIILYTGIDPQQKQVQNYAIPANLSDPYLRVWVKPDNNPLVVPTADMNSSAFRDPTTAWIGKDGHFKMIVGSKRKHRGLAVLYRSRDFMHWTKAKHPLHSVANIGMWECPDFFPVALDGEMGQDTSKVGNTVKHVFKVSLDETRYEYYTVGTYDHEKERYVPDNTSDDGRTGLRYDYGNFYASKSFFDPSKNRRVLWGWANESDTTDEERTKGWAGIQLIPRTVWLDANQKQLVQWPIKEIETLRGQNVQMSNQKLASGTHVEIKGITPAQADVEVTFSLPSLDKAEQFNSSWFDAQTACGQRGSDVQGGVGPFGLLTLASEDLQEFTPVFFRIFKAQDKHVVLMCSDARRSSLQHGIWRPSYAGYVDVDLSSGKLALRTLIDNSVVESFGAGGKTCISSRVYPTLAVAGNAHLYAFNNGTEAVTIDNLNAWTMQSPARMN